MKLSNYKSINVLIISVVLLLAPLSTIIALGVEETDVVPAYQPSVETELAPVKLPPIEEKILDNGLKIVAIEHHELPVESLSLMCKSGSKYDPPGKAGLNQFMVNLLDKGTQNYSATEIADKIDYMGGRLGAGSSWDATFITCTVLKKYLDTGLEILGEVVLQPAFSDSEITRCRQRTLSSIESDKDDPRAVVYREFSSWLFGDHPYANQLEGDAESLQSITREDIVEQHKKVFLPNNSVFYVIGDIKAKDAFQIIEDKFGSWEGSDILSLDLPQITAPQEYKVHLVDKPDATQAQICIGHLGIARDNEDYFPVSIMNYILGGGSFASRLTKSIRSQKGLTYHISSRFMTFKDAGFFRIYTFTKTASTEETIRETIDILKNFIEEGPDDDELRDAKAYYTGSYPLNFETPSDIANQLRNTEIYDLGSDYIEKYRSRVNSVTREDVISAARKYLHPDDMIIVIVGRAEEIKADVEGIGPVEVLTIGDVF